MAAHAASRVQPPRMANTLRSGERAFWSTRTSPGVARAEWRMLATSTRPIVAAHVTGVPASPRAACSIHTSAEAFQAAKSGLTSGTFTLPIPWSSSMFAFDGVSIPPEQWGALRFVPALTINRWAIRLLYDGVVENYQPPADGDAAAEERRRHAYAMMLALGVGWRAVAFACLRRRTRQSA